MTATWLLFCFLGVRSVLFALGTVLVQFQFVAVLPAQVARRVIVERLAHGALEANDGVLGHGI